MDSSTLQLFLLLIITRWSDTKFVSKYKYSLNIKMPSVCPIVADQYLCTAVRVNTSKPVYIHEMTLNFTKGRAHHYLLYGCDKISEELLQLGAWPCKIQSHGNNCRGRKQIPTGLKSPDDVPGVFKYPPGVGYAIGSKFKINYILLEVHYLKVFPRDVTDESGVKLSGSIETPKFLAGTLLLAAMGFRIPPHKNKFSVDVNCKPIISQAIHPYAAWVHTHDLGSVVSAYYLNSRKKPPREITRWTHHWPQPIILDSQAESRDYRRIQPGDFVAARCTYNSSSVNNTVQWGSKRSDEMCNFFLYYYTELSSQPEQLSLSCVNEISREVSNLLPGNSNTLPFARSQHTP